MKLFEFKHRSCYRTEFTTTKCHCENLEAFKKSHKKSEMYWEIKDIKELEMFTYSVEVKITSIYGYADKFETKIIYVSNKNKSLDWEIDDLKRSDSGLEILSVKLVDNDTQKEIVAEEIQDAEWLLFEMDANNSDEASIAQGVSGINRKTTTWTRAEVRKSLGLPA